MDTNYDDIFSEYKNVTRELVIMKYAEEFTILGLLGDVKDKIVLDLACGEGRFVRRIMHRSACRLVGVDISERMVELAVKADQEVFRNVEFIVCDICHLGELHRFDIVAAIFLFDYAPTTDRLLAMCRTAYNNLKSRGKLVAAINSTPIYALLDNRITHKYGYAVNQHGSLSEGELVEYSFFHPVILSALKNITGVNKHTNGLYGNQDSVQLDGKPPLFQKKGSRTLALSFGRNF